MSNSPQFISLEPEILDDKRVTLHLKTTGFPPVSNVSLNFERPATATPADLPHDQELLDPTQAYRESPYPNVELCLLNKNNVPVAEVSIIQHQEETVSFTLHLKNPQPGTQYTAMATMTYGPDTIHTLKTPFVLAVTPKPFEE